jgi:hypothetical protein
MDFMETRIVETKAEETRELEICEIKKSLAHTRIRRSEDIARLALTAHKN